MKEELLSRLSIVTDDLSGTQTNWRLEASHPLVKVATELASYAAAVRAATTVDPAAAQRLMDFADRIENAAVDPQRPDLARDVVAVTGSLKQFVLSRSPMVGHDGLRFSGA